MTSITFTHRPEGLRPCTLEIAALCARRAKDATNEVQEPAKSGIRVTRQTHRMLRTTRQLSTQP